MRIRAAIIARIFFSHAPNGDADIAAGGQDQFAQCQQFRFRRIQVSQVGRISKIEHGGIPERQRYIQFRIKIGRKIPVGGVKMNVGFPAGNRQFIVQFKSPYFYIDLYPHHVRIGNAEAIAAQRGIGGCIDISDGLLLDLWTMLQASGGLGAELDASRVPLHPTCLRRARGNRAKALQAALGEGEDHELLFTVRRGRNLPPGGPLGARARRPIGRVLAEPGLWLVEDGVRRAVAPRGHEHHVPGS